MQSVPTVVAERAEWYAVQTKPGQEERAEANLLNLGVETFLPKTRGGPRGSNGRSSLRPKPFFPSYLFVRCEILGCARTIASTRGVARVLGTAGAPLPIEPSIIDLLRARMERDGLIRIAPSFRSGDLVRVMNGPLKDFIGVFDETRPAERVAILLKTVTSYVRVVVDEDAVQHA